MLRQQIGPRALMCWVRKCCFHIVTFQSWTALLSVAVSLFTVRLNPYPCWFLLICADCQRWGQEWLPPMASWQGVCVQGTNAPSSGAVSWDSQSGANGQNKGLSLQVYSWSSIASCCCFCLLWSSLPDCCNPSQASFVSDRQMGTHICFRSQLQLGPQLQCSILPVHPSPITQHDFSRVCVYYCLHRNPQTPIHKALANWEEYLGYCKDFRVAYPCYADHKIWRLE